MKALTLHGLAVVVLLALWTAGIFRTVPAKNESGCGKFVTFIYDESDEFDRSVMLRYC